MVVKREPENSSYTLVKENVICLVLFWFATIRQA